MLLWFVLIFYCNCARPAKLIAPTDCPSCFCFLHRVNQLVDTRLNEQQFPNHPACLSPASSSQNVSEWIYYLHRFSNAAKCLFSSLWNWLSLKTIHQLSHDFVFLCIFVHLLVLIRYFFVFFFSPRCEYDGFGFNKNYPPRVFCISIVFFFLCCCLWVL